MTETVTRIISSYLIHLKNTYIQCKDQIYLDNYVAIQNIQYSVINVYR